jgi:hypothetical protein
MAWARVRGPAPAPRGRGGHGDPPPRAEEIGAALDQAPDFYPSGLIAAGCDVVTVQRALGHFSATITWGVHSYLGPTAEDRTLAAAGGLMAAALGARADWARTGES